MKKFISLMAAVAMLSSLFATSALAADYPAGPAVLKGSTRLATESEVTSYTSFIEEELGDEFDDSYTVYALDIAIDGLGTFKNTNTPAKPEGILPELLTYVVDFGADVDNIFGVDGDPVFVAAGKLNPAGTTFTPQDSEITINWTLSGAQKSFTKNEEIDGDTVVLTAIFGLSGASSCTVIDGVVSLGVHAKNIQATEYTNYKPFNSNLTLSPASLTFGGAPVVTTHTITFVDYDNSSSTVVVNDGEAINAPAAKGQTGYNFSGWSSTSHSGAVDLVSGTTAASADATYYAVYAPIAVSTVTISGATSATVGDTVALSATVLPADALNKAVTWTKVSGDGSVDASGNVTANSAGDIVVKATAGGVDSANYTVTFAPATKPATAVAIKGGATKAVVGDTVTFTADVEPSDTTDVVVWSIVGDGANVENGVVTATKPGKFTVRATAGSVSDSKDITFVAVPAAPVITNAAAASVTVGDYNYKISNAKVEAPDFANFIYNVWAKDDKEVTETVGTITAENLKNFEGEGIVSFLLMVKSKNHTITETGITPVLK